MLKIIIIFILLLFNYSYADSLYDNIDNDDIQISNLNKNANSILNQKITINKTFNNIDQVSLFLSSMTNLNIKILNQSADKITYVKINQTSGSISNFLDKVTNKFNYSWKLDKNQIILTANNPVKERLQSSISNISRNNKDINLMSQTWQLSTIDKTLRNALFKWSTTAGWQLVWNVNADYPITNNWNITGTFESAINQVLKATEQTDAPLLAKMHDSNKVIEIYSPSKN